MKIEDIRALCSDETIEVTSHMLQRLQKRNITYSEVKQALCNGGPYENFKKANISLSKNNAFLFKEDSSLPLEIEKFKQKEKFFMRGGGTVKYILWEGRKIDFRCLLKYINC